MKKNEALQRLPEARTAGFRQSLIKRASTDSSSRASIYSFTSCQEKQLHKCAVSSCVPVFSHSCSLSLDFHFWLSELLNPARSQAMCPGQLDPKSKTTVGQSVLWTNTHEIGLVLQAHRLRKVKWSTAQNHRVSREVALVTRASLLVPTGKQCMLAPILVGNTTSVERPLESTLPRRVG